MKKSIVLMAVLVSSVTSFAFADVQNDKVMLGSKGKVCATGIAHSTQVVATKKIGIVIFDGFLTSEVTAPIEVFGYSDKDDINQFTIQLIAESMEVVKSREGLQLLPDVTFKDNPRLDILIVPSSYNIKASEKNSNVVNFIKEQGAQVEYLASNCAGAFIVGEAGLLEGKKVVTYVGGGADLKKRFPNAIVQNDKRNTVIVDGNYISSNGALVSYKSAFKLLEMISGKQASDRRKADLFYNQLIK